MSTPINVPDLQNALAGVSQIGQAAASPFIKSASGQATEQKVVAEVNLGIAALPLLAQLFSTISGLFHHAHAVASAPAPAPVLAIAPAVAAPPVAADPIVTNG